MNRHFAVAFFALLVAFGLSASNVFSNPVGGVAESNDEEIAARAFFKSDYATAFRIYRKLAEKGDHEKQRFVGSMYGLGQGVPQNYKESVKWYRMAAVQDDWLAQGALGMAYEYGNGVPQDYVRAYMWYNLSVAHGLPEGYTEAFSSRKDRDEVAGLLTPSQLELAQDMSTRCQASNYENCD